MGRKRAASRQHARPLRRDADGPDWRALTAAESAEGDGKGLSLGAHGGRTPEAAGELCEEWHHIIGRAVRRRGGEQTARRAREAAQCRS